MALCVVAIPLAVIDFLDLDLGILSIVAFPSLVVFGCTGALVAILERAGIVQFSFTEDDKRRLHYRMAKFVAEMEMHHGRKFSPRYYQTYGLDRGKKEPGEVPRN